MAISPSGVLSGSATSILSIPVYKTSPSGRFLVVEQEINKKKKHTQRHNDKFLFLKLQIETDTILAPLLDRRGEPPLAGVERLSFLHR